MNNDEKILKALEDLQAGQKALQADVQRQGQDIASLRTGQEQQGEQLVKQGEQLAKQGAQLDLLEAKTEAIHEYQKQAHDEIIEKIFESNEINGQEQKALEKRIEVLEEHAGIPHPDKN
jgi:hypothetical protein